jgi:hypothetical protein
MPIKGAEYAVAQMITTLQTYLPAELDIIDADMADGITLDDVADADYYAFEVDDAHTPAYPAIVVDARASIPVAITTTTHSPGTDQSDHEIVVSVLMNNSANESKATLKKRILRYARAVVNVAAMKYPRLGTATGIVQCKREGAGPAFYRDEEDETAYLRTAEIPFLVQTYEYV